MSQESKEIEFRVNVKLTGKFRRLSNSREASKAIGSAIVKNMGINKWRINPRNPYLEISVYLTDSGLIFAVPLTSRPLSDRKYLTHIPLRSTVAYSMASLLFENKYLDATNPVFILDPMCGTGTILIEIAKNFGNKVDMIYGTDTDPEQVSKCLENITSANVEDQVCLLQSDSTTKIPLRIQFDCIICDIPFGQQHDTNTGILADMPKVISAMNESLKPNGRIVLLISCEISSSLQDSILTTNSVSWKLIHKYPVKLGELQAQIFVFEK